MGEVGRMVGPPESRRPGEGGPADHLGDPLVVDAPFCMVEVPVTCADHDAAGNCCSTYEFPYEPKKVKI